MRKSIFRYHPLSPLQVPRREQNVTPEDLFLSPVFAMRIPFLFVFLGLLLVPLTGCSNATLAALQPAVSVTPALQPIVVEGATIVPVHSPDQGQSGIDIESELLSATVGVVVSEPQVERTPIRLKVAPLSREVDPRTEGEMVAQVQATIVPTNTQSADMEAQLESTATLEPATEAPPTDTPIPLTDTPTPSVTPSATATPEPPTSTPTEVVEVIEEEIEPTPTIGLASADDQVADELLPTPAARPQGLDNTLNILIVGSDERGERGAWRSDVMMVAAIDFANREVGVVSFPRDMWVRIPTVGQNRLNTATFFGELYKYPDGGGIGLLKETLGQTFGIRIDHYIKFDFNSFRDVIDALGGIDVELDCPLTGRFPLEPGSEIIVQQTLEPGIHHMDGAFALKFVRNRKSTSDIDRTRRQQRLLIAIRKRALEVNIIPRIPALYSALEGTIENDLGLADIIALARLGLQVDPSKAHGYVIGYRDLQSWRTPSGAAVLLPNIQAISANINTLFEQPSILKNPVKPSSCR